MLFDLAYNASPPSNKNDYTQVAIFAKIEQYAVSFWQAQAAGRESHHHYTILHSFGGSWFGFRHLTTDRIGKMPCKILILSILYVLIQKFALCLSRDSKAIKFKYRFSRMDANGQEKKEQVETKTEGRAPDAASATALELATRGHLFQSASNF